MLGVRDAVAWHWFDARETNYSKYTNQELQEAAGDIAGSSSPLGNINHIITQCQQLKKYQQ